VQAVCSSVMSATSLTDGEVPLRITAVCVAAGPVLLKRFVVLSSSTLYTAAQLLLEVRRSWYRLRCCSAVMREGCCLLDS
jgi:hypothetical protein